MAENGNGSFKAIDIDVTDDAAFKTGVVQYLQLITDATRCIPDLKRKVDNHETIVKFGKWLSVPLLGLFQFALKHPVEKVWNFFAK